MNPRAPQTNPNLLSPQKHINSDWVRVFYFSGARKRNSRRREARKIACENIRFSSLFADGDVSRGEEREETDAFAGYSQEGWA